MGRQEYDTWVCPNCGKKLIHCSREMRGIINKEIDANADLSIHFMHKLIERLELTDDK